MEILSYKKVKNNLYEMYLDNGKEYKIYDDIILKYELLIDKHLTEKKLKNVLNDNEMMDAYYIALRYIAVRMRTEKEISIYLRKKELSETSISYAVKRLNDEGYLNSEKYTEAFINDSINLSMNGPKKIEESLMKLGIKKYIIDNYLERIDHKVWVERIEKLIEKKAKVNKNSAPIFKNKMYSNLIMLGYDSEDIRSLLDDYKIDTDAAFIKDADKAWRLLSQKYSDKDLIMRFKNKMYTKGYSSQDISEYINKKED